MKKIVLLTGCWLAAAIFLPCQHANAQILEIAEEIIKEAIMEVDLGVQKVQTETVFLQDAQKAVENAMQEAHLNDITDWVQKQKDLYSEYYQELVQVKNVISTYERVKDIISKQERIVEEYKASYDLIKKDSHFNSQELNYIYGVYSGILDQSVKNLQQLTVVVTSFLSQMSDGDRMKLIDGVGSEVDRNYSDLNSFTQSNILISLQRARSQTDAEEIKSLYGIE
jgi:hypothetical protein